MDGQNRNLGEQGENFAVEFLRGQGYKIIERNFRFRSGEIDIIARDQDVLCFVEVKLRNSLRRGSSAEAVTPAKQKKLGRLALLYLRKHFDSLDVACRFDVVAVSPDELGRNRIEVIKNAFDFRG